MTTLPAIPSPGMPIALDDVIAIETRIAQQIATVTDVDDLEEMRAKTDALARYLQGKELHGPMLGAQRRIEARIGQLLGEPINGSHDSLPREGRSVSPSDRNRFRLLARGFDVLTDEEWRQSRRALLSFLSKRYPVPRAQPEVVVQKNGIVKKSREQRVIEIAELAGQGYRASQISEEIGISEEQVRNIARAGSITLPDASLAKSRKIDPRRVVEHIVTGLEGSTISLQTIGKDFSGITGEEARIWADSLGKSISQLKRLRSALLEIANGSRADAGTGTEMGTKGCGAGEDQNSPARAA